VPTSPTERTSIQAIQRVFPGSAWEVPTRESGLERIPETVRFGFGFFAPCLPKSVRADTMSLLWQVRA
jgi:hypothetical protein